MARFQTLIETVRIDILARDPGIQGFNIGINVGEMAGYQLIVSLPSRIS